jgi:hypothetical protein
MELTLEREPATQHSTPGTLTGLSVSFFSLEPPPVSNPSYPGGPVCIPAGRYRVIMAHSPHFSCMVPLLLDVPGRSEIEIHFGNTIESLQHDLLGHTIFLSLGCILVGMGRNGPDMITNTLAACENILWPAITAAEVRGEETWITVLDVK